MKNLTLGSHWLKHEAARKKGSARSVARRKDVIEFAGKNGLLILTKRITGARFKAIVERSMRRNVARNPDEWKLGMVNHVGKDLDMRTLMKKDLAETGAKQRSPIDRGDIMTSLIMTKLVIVSKRRR